MKTTKKPIFIPMTEEGLDDLFIYKHRWEAENGYEKHMPLTEFVTQKAGMGNKAFRCKSTDNVVPFGTIKVGDNAVFIYSPSDKVTDEAFFDMMESCGYDVTKLKKHDIRDIDFNIGNVDFITVNGEDILY